MRDSAARCRALAGGPRAGAESGRIKSRQKQPRAAMDAAVAAKRVFYQAIRAARLPQAKTLLPRLAGGHGVDRQLHHRYLAGVSVGRTRGVSVAFLCCLAT